MALRFFKNGPRRAPAALEDTLEGSKSIELVEKTAHRLGTFFGLPNRFHLIQCVMQGVSFNQTSVWNNQ